MCSDQQLSEGKGKEDDEEGKKRGDEGEVDEEDGVGI